MLRLTEPRSEFFAAGEDSDGLQRKERKESKLSLCDLCDLLRLSSLAAASAAPGSFVVKACCPKLRVD